MNTRALEKFAQAARRQLHEQVEAKLDRVLETDSAELRAQTAAIQELEKQIAQTSREAVIERVAYTWFNRFCALRYMDVNHYTRMGTVSPAAGYTQPEILQEAKQGHIDDRFERYVDQETVFGLLSGRRPASDPQGEAYRLLLVAVCNYYHSVMPFMFQRIDDYSQLLMPDDLLSAGSILQAVRDTLTPEACQDVEVIGWLYQFYISEKKDEVFAYLKENKKIEAEDIPAATQLFTPHWIVRYLVENSLGRLWMLNHPNSRLVHRMDYYIQPQDEEHDYLRLQTPEHIEVCDPACGSGHMLTYAFDLLHSIYEEEGYSAPDIPRLILETNLYGIEIDERAGALAAFALMMKARKLDRRLFQRGVRPSICVLEKVAFGAQELERYTETVGHDLFTKPLRISLRQFEGAGKFGSLIRPEVKNAGHTLHKLSERGAFDSLFLDRTNQEVQRVLRQAKYLGSKYSVIVTNPPYMGWGGMNEELRGFADDQYRRSRNDACTMFIERSLELAKPLGMVSMITMPSWMFLKSFEAFRKNLLNNATIVSLTYNGRGVWGSDFGSVSFILKKYHSDDFRGQYRKLFKKQGEVNSNEILKQRFSDREEYQIYEASSRRFSKVPGSRIAFWLKTENVFNNQYLSDFLFSGGRNKTHNNEKYLRYSWEVSISSESWPIYSKGGDYRKFYGNETFVVDWSTRARSFYASNGGLYNPRFWGKEGITWTKSSAIVSGFRVKRAICHYSGNSPVLFNSEFNYDEGVLAFLNSRVASYLLNIFNPTFSTQLGDVLNLPYVMDDREIIVSNVDRLVKIHQMDWDDYENSRDFSVLPLLKEGFGHLGLGASYNRLRAHCEEVISETSSLEEENNHIFIEAYGLEDELTPQVPVQEITLTCNPHYRYPDTKRKTYNSEERQALLLADTMREFISYAVGCMFGRYSLDKLGLVLANQRETAADYRRQVPEPSFPPDEDNVIPVLDGDWFSDDISERFKGFLRITFGVEHYEGNLAFIEEALGRDIRNYFLREFYNHHVKMYKKRPIYWLFSSPKGSFNAVVYMHRYRPDTVSIVLNDYLREFRTKLTARKAHLQRVSISAAAAQRDKTQALREIDKIDKILNELKEYEDEILYPLAAQQIEIDLDDGVKVNYNKFGEALKRVPGLSR